MSDSLHAVRPWLTFIGCVLVGVVLYLAQAILVPVALAVLLAFLLTPVVLTFERYVGRVPAVLATVLVTFTALAVVGWVVTQQLASVAQELPTYRHNIHQKILDVRVVGKGGSVEALQKTVEQIQSDMGTPATGTATRPIVVRAEPVSGLWSFPAVVTPFVGPLSTAGLVVVLVIFMLLERAELRNRLIRLCGHGRLVVTTKAFDEAGRRVSRYLLVQSFVNLVYAVGVAIGLFVIGVPYASLWAVLAGLLRFIPYVGPTVGAAAPIAVALAALAGWTRPFLVLGLFVVLELFTNLVLEAVLYAGAVGVSQVALLIAIAFWSWLWGPLGLLLATPLTVCLAVLGKYVPGLEFVATLISAESVLDTDLSYYQRLLAGDRAEASELLERHVAAEPPGSIYDAMMLPALSYAERDRMADRLEPAEERAVVEATAEILNDMLEAPVALEAVAQSLGMPVLGLAADGTPDVLALRMLGHLLADTPFTLEIQDRTVLSAELIEAVKRGRYCAICIADIPRARRRARVRSCGDCAHSSPIYPSWSAGGHPRSSPTNRSTRSSPQVRRASQAPWSTRGRSSHGSRQRRPPSHRARRPREAPRDRFRAPRVTASPASTSKPRCRPLPPFARAGRACEGRTSRALAGGVFLGAVERELHNEGCARVRPTFGANRTAMVFDDAPADRESDPGAGGRSLPAGELLEEVKDLLGVAGRESLTIVMDPHLAVLRAVAPNDTAVDPDVQGRPGAPILDRVLDQVAEELPPLSAINGHGRQVADLNRGCRGMEVEGAVSDDLPNERSDVDIGL